MKHTTHDTMSAHKTHQKSLRPVLWLVLVCTGAGLLFTNLSVTTVAHAADAYYTTLQQQLQTTYGLSNAGTFPIADTESGVLAQGQPVFLNGAQGTPPQVVSVSGEPFSQAVQLNTPTLPRKNWYLLQRYTNTAGIAQNDVVHLVFWIRATQTQTSVGQIGAKLSSNGVSWVSRDIAVTSSWTRYDLPGTAVNAAGVGNAYLEFFYSDQLQTIQIGGIALLDYGQDASNLSKLPTTPVQLAYPGEDPNAAWRTAANQRIDQYRKANLTVVVKDQQGNVVPNANVAVHMTKQGFQFSTAASDYYGYVAPNATYQDKLINTNGPGQGFNMIEEENDLKWDRYENTTTRANVAAFIQWAHANGLQFRGHNLVWPCNFPADINQGYQSNGLNWLLSAIHSHITDEASYYGTSINEWDVINEPTQNDCVESAMQSQGMDYVAEYANWFQLARNALGTGVPLYINDEGATTHSGADVDTQTYYRNLVQALLQKGAPIDGVGFESHFDSPQSQLTDPADLISIFNSFAALSPDLKMKVTEFDLKLDTITDPTLRAQLEYDYTRDYMTAVFSEPQMTGFQIWDFWDGDSWINYAPIFNEDWSVKSSGKAYLDLVYNQWWTNTSGSTDTAGSYTTRAFKGNYSITATAGGQSQTVNAVLNNDQTVTVTLGSGGNNGGGSSGSLPSPWQSQDIGSVGHAGSASYNNGTYTLTGSGSAIAGDSDAFQYAYQPLNGDGSIIARVDSINDTDPSAVAGAMIRESLSPGAANAFVGITAGNGAIFQNRSSTGGDTTIHTATGASVPYWVQLVRQGNTITASISSDGSYWSTIGSATFSMASSVYIGLAVTAHNNSSLTSANLSMVSTTGSSGGGGTTGGLPSPWQTQNIGSVGQTGSATYAGSTFTVAGSGGDIGGSTDAFRFVYQPLNGDGTVIARIDSIQNTDPQAKVGVMIRNTLDPTAANAFMAITPGNGGTLQCRATGGGSTTSTPAPDIAVPYQVKLTRSGNTITGAISSDGSYWSSIGSCTISLNSPAFIGLAVTSHNTSSLNSATLDTVSVSG